jgi:hypothetical protein
VTLLIFKQNFFQNPSLCWFFNLRLRIGISIKAGYRLPELGKGETDETSWRLQAPLPPVSQRAGVPV